MNDDRKRVYVAGPYTQGDWGTNIRNAIEAGERIHDAGHYPFVPHTMTAAWSIVYPKDHAGWLDLDFGWLEVCDAMVRLGGRSRGADMEEAFADDHGIPVYYSVDALLAAV